MATSADARRLRSLAFVCAGIVIVTALLGFSRGAFQGIWLAAGALAGSLAMLAAVWRLSSVAQDWRRELRSCRQEIGHLTKDYEARRGRLLALSEGLGEPLLLCRSDGVIEYANEAAKQFFHFSEPVGRTVLAVSLSYELHSFVLAVDSVQRAREEELNISYPDARTVLARAWKAVEDSDLTYVSLRDASELRRLEKIRTDFVANVSHELRTPMASIRAMTETILEDTKLSAQTKKKYLEKIIQEVDRLTNISEDLLILSAAESGPSERMEADLADIVRYAAGQVESQARERGLSLFLEVPEFLPVVGDRRQLIQVFLNLLTNAIRYTSEGNIFVRATSSGGEAVVEVEDTGIGIASEHLPRIFERFYRVDKARSRDTGGTGLGLSIVRHIVESNGGVVEVQSELNVGSTFRVRFPLVKTVA